MKQLLQSLRDGTTTIADVPAPGAGAGQLLIRSSLSLVSAGTERMMVEFGRGSLLSKVRQQPDKVRMVLEKARTDGISATVDAVRAKLDQPLAPGYCNVGRVIESQAEGLVAGDRVVSNGAHAEIVAIPRNLCARIPDGVSDETAAFTVLGSIGLQAIRLANPTLGECVAVTGLGLIGLLTVQMLRAQGCRVLGIDPDEERRALARSFGAETVSPLSEQEVLAKAAEFSRGRGIDAVILAAATSSSAPVSQAARMSRVRGRIILVGVTGLELSRADFYEKELSFQVSCSYGPGRYDANYEQRGQDYPVGFVRWTEQRNFEAVLDLMAAGTIDVSLLVTHRFAIEDGAAAMDLLASDTPHMGILLGYAADEGSSLRRVALSSAPVAARGTVGVLGAGNHATRALLPAFKAAGAGLHTVVSAGGVSAAHAARRFGVVNAATNPAMIIDDPAIDTVVVATRHDAHAGQVLAALRAGKHVFCEKPLCLTLAELDEIEREAASRPQQRLMVGFNRRFAPLTVKIEELLATLSGPRHMTMTVNAGAVPPGHWTQDRDVGGGRILGEACHFIDLLRHLAGAPISGIEARAMRGADISGPADSATIMISFADGSLGAVHYLTNGPRALPKERLEIFASGRALQLDNFRALVGRGWPGFARRRLWRQDKGGEACARAFIDAVRSEAPDPIPRDEIFEVSRSAILAAAALD
ncbi:bi-domain-containing oxidoreductase [Rhizorhabdus dicambivorans]|uniref:Dehydrogenase n=1 Tax=Rhizorhabdus dicambivorans TaxID=1850238 RepID=A0A2A4FPW0_9SPHN|nr:bi-domain-containing oxidoreductase [Rhizorhabdus dicambivorans]ATE66179.1 dehydrogenase [Rhizorhabdus dicambivorans]PCE39740.1 dehydrogenase [Rhizorhabdus dicambivorans]